MATEAEKELFASKVLEPIGREASTLPSTPLTGFLAMRGSLYDRGLMVVGRAVNGWTEEGVLPKDLGTPSKAAEFADLVYKESIGDGECPMRWVTEKWSSHAEYNTRRSAFWRVIRCIVKKLNPAAARDNSWPSHLVWTNLYKVAPHEGGNPENRLRRVQLCGCRELLELEFETYRPSQVLFLTGADWAEPFLKKCMPTVVGSGRRANRQLGYVSSSGTCTLQSGHSFRWVVACHPQGKNEELWVKDVLKALPSS